ncbi:hypothetical protein JCM8547_009314 [Rhodosporidiobolus lusitaniae]
MTRLSNHPASAALLDSVNSSLVSFRDTLDSFARTHPYFCAFQLAFLSVLFFLFLQSAFPSTPLEPQPRNPMSGVVNTVENAAIDAAVKVADVAVPKPPAPQLDPPKDTPFSKEELSKYDGKDEKTPIYVAIKGQIFDVSAKRDMYGPGCGYHVFVGKDASRGLGKSSLKPEDAVADYSTLEPSEMKVLDDWEAFFKKRYNIVGLVKE